MSAEESELQLIPLKSIVPSPHNPRKTFDEDGLGQLAESIRMKGVLEPILVRPAKYGVVSGRDSGKPGFFVCPLGPDGRETTLGPFFKHESDAKAACPKYELIAGERRWRASDRAEKKVIPALVRNLNDREAAEVAVIENDQREDVPPLEQARGYQRLIELGDIAETIAAKIGRPPKYVVGRLQLTKLIESLQQDLEKGKLPFGHAYLISKLKADDQVAIVKEGRLYDYNEQPCRLDGLKRQIRDGFLSCLSAAPWKKDDADLVPTAGACTTCPKRTGSNRTLFDELLNGEAKKGRDFCTDRTCYRTKQAAFVELQIATAAEKTGGEVVRITEEWHTRDKGVLTRGDYDVVSKKEAKTAKPGELKTAIVVNGDDQVGQLVQIRVRKARPSSGQDEWKRREAKQREAAKVGKAAAVAACGMVAAKTMSAAASVTGWSPALVRMIKAAVSQWASVDHSDACRMIAKRRDLGASAHNHTDKVAELAMSMEDAPSLLGLFAEFIAADKSCWWGNSGPDDAKAKEFWATWGVDRSKLMKLAADESKPAKVKAKVKKRAKVTA